MVAYEPWAELAGSEPYMAALRTMSIDLAMAAGTKGADLAHSHTWYANLGGHLGGLVHEIPHVATVHSLEPLRPWKAEQLGGGYSVSSFCERSGLEGADAIIAVSAAMRRDLINCYPAVDPGRVIVIHNGIDTDEFAPDRGTDALVRLGVDPDRPVVLFVGRVTRQKGLPAPARGGRRHRSRRAARALRGHARHAGARRPRSSRRVEALRAAGHPVLWIEEMLPRPDLIQLLTHATVFVCPSVYEPLGIVNLEAMACETAVVATHTGGIPEVVEEGVTGLLVPLELRDDGVGRARRPGRVRCRLLGADQRAPRRPGRSRAARQGRPRARSRRVRLVRRSRSASSISTSA